MTTQAHAQRVRPSQLAVACATALITHHTLFAAALKMVAHPPDETVLPAGYVAPDGYDWTAAGELLAKARDHALRSISALHLAAVEDRAVQADVSHAAAQHALACLNGVLALHDPLRAAVRNCAVLGGSRGAWPSTWANLSFQLDEMRDQAKGSIASVQVCAHQEAATVEHQGKVFGDGEHEFEVMVTMQTTAHRFIHVRADDADQARNVALTAAQEQQGAHFILNEGNYVDHDDLHANAVYDHDGGEVWSDDPASRACEPSGESPSM